MARILIAGFQHETNTFAPVKADFKAFDQSDEWPGLCLDENVFSAVAGVPIPISGAIEALRANFELVPLLWCSATPSAHVTKRAFETISRIITDRLRQIDAIDGIYLDLHGAMVCEHLDDGEGELLERIRHIVGPSVPISVSLDLHANITERMFSNASVIDCFRTYPHVDMIETGARAAKHLEYLIDTKQSHYLFSTMRRASFLISHNWGSTLCEPCRTLYQKVSDHAHETQVVCFASGFALADIKEAGPVILAYGEQERSVEEAADKMLTEIEDAKPQFKGLIYSPKEVIELANTHLGDNHFPVIIADTQDNPGAGGAGDTVGLLREMLRSNAEEVVMATILDPQATQQAHNLGVGNSFKASLGEHANPARQPLKGEFEVLALGDGCFTATGPMYKGSQMKLGLMALVRIHGVRIIIASMPIQVADQSIFRHLGVEPCEQKIICIKGSVHFRNDFQSLAAEILLVAAPGAAIADLKQLDYHHIARSMII